MSFGSIERGVGEERVVGEFIDLIKGGKKEEFTFEIFKQGLYTYVMN